MATSPTGDRIGNQWMKNTRLYIMPTRFGFVFITGAVLMILVGSAYQNNLVNMLAFFMLSLIFVCMLQTHNNMKDVSVESIDTEGGFAGSEFIATTVLINGSKVARYNLETRLRHLVQKSVYDNVYPLAENGVLKIKSTYPAQRRGLFTVDRARVSSVYPLGLFEAWSWHDITSTYFVYPAKQSTRPFPVGSALEDDLGHISHPTGGDDFHGHRRFQLGDSYRHVDWKALARGRPMLVKEFTEGAPGSALLDWYALEGLDTESKLSQLAAWVEDARQRKLVFALRLPGHVIPPGQGTDHAIECWKKLAAFDGASAAKNGNKSS